MMDCNFDVEKDTLYDVLAECALDGIVTCRNCGLTLDCDTPECPECGWKNKASEVI
jgi:hypothetical protein